MNIILKKFDLSMANTIYICIRCICVPIVTFHYNHTHVDVYIKCF